jgi:hypothetical protein
VRIKWVRVEDGLPLQYTTVLVFSSESYGLGFVFGPSDGWYVDGDVPADRPVTHWMPLPEKPV